MAVTGKAIDLEIEMVNTTSRIVAIKRTTIKAYKVTWVASAILVEFTVYKFVTLVEN